MAKAVNSRFLSLFRHCTPPEKGAIFADDRSLRFPDVVATSPVLELWQQHNPIPSSGSFLLVGVATWSGYDMQLLDEVEAALERPDRVGVFDLQDVHTPDDFAMWIPGLTGVVQGPVAGLWQHGRLVDSGAGHVAQTLVFRVCRIPLTELSTRLEPANLAKAV
jgi:hypothetical protein